MERVMAHYNEIEAFRQAEEEKLIEAGCGARRAEKKKELEQK